MNTIGLLIFSKDRDAQLDLLLRSVNDNNLNCNVTILYKTGGIFQVGYDTLRKKYPQHNWYHERNFQDDTKIILRSFLDNGLTSFAFATDDCVLYRPLKFTPTVNHGEVFSLRLGLNTTVQNCHTGEMQPVLNTYVDYGSYLEWNPKNYNPQHNYGYPLALDLHVLYTQQILNMLNFNFYNTNLLEGNLQKFNSQIQIMRSFHESVAVNVPCNNLSGFTQTSDNYSREELHNRFMARETLYVKPDKIVGCHQELEFVWKTDN